MSAPVATPFPGILGAAARPGEPSWLAALRRDAAARFAAQGLPTPKLEAWRTTPLPDLGVDLTAATPRDLPLWLQACVATFRADGSSVFVLVDGLSAPALSTAASALPKGVRVTSTSAAVRDPGATLEAWMGGRALPGGAMADLNTAGFQDGAWIEVDEGASPAEEIRVVNIATADAGEAARLVRNFLKVGRGARARVTFIDIGGEGARGFLDTRTSVDVTAEARLTLTRVHRAPLDLVHHDSLDARLGARSEVADTLLQTGPSWTRAEIDVDLAAERATADLGGVFIARGRGQITDIHTSISHNAPGVVSRQNYRGLAAEEGRGVFHGQIRVAAGARGADATQSNKNMLLSRRAQVHSTPALEILTDDVKCKHGSATGQIDAAQLFYLRSRGIDEQDAVRILTRAFASEILSRIEGGSTRDLVESLIAPDVEALEVAR